jgi:hypothetical protein
LQILSLSQQDTRPGCRLQSQAFGEAVEVSGLAASELAWLFGYPGGSAFAWQELHKRGPIRIALVAASDSEHRGAATVTTELSDGRVRCRSGQEAMLCLDPCHENPADRFARSLNLALSQQWARAGLMTVHAAGVAVDESGTVVLGSKASGKSTLTAAVLAGGGKAVSDDWMLLGADRDGQPQMERLRGFLMLRRSWATDRLLVNQANLNYLPMEGRPKLALAADDQDHRFPVSHPVDQVCLLKRTAARSERSSRFSVLPRTAMSALIAASMPLLFSQQFPIERDCLSGLVDLLLRKTSLFGAIAGMDIPSKFQCAARLLVTKTPRSCNRVDAEQE